MKLDSKKEVLFMNIRPAIDLNFCQFVRKYVVLHTNLPRPENHVAVFQFEGNIHYLACSNFFIDESLVWPREFWFLSARRFLKDFRSNNYKPLLKIAFPVPHFSRQKNTNEFTLILLLLDRLSFLDSLSSESFSLIMAEFLEIFDNQDNSILDLLLQISIHGQQRSILKIDSFFPINHLTPILQKHVAEQTTGPVDTPPLTNVLLNIYNNFEKSYLKTHYKSLFDHTIINIQFFNKCLTYDEFTNYWLTLSYNNNVIILNENNADVNLAFANKNCRVQKARCWVFKQITRIEHFEQKLSSGISLILFLPCQGKILVYEIGQNQKNNPTYSTMSLKNLITFFPENPVYLSSQDVWLMVEMHIMALYQNQYKKTAVLEEARQFTIITNNTSCQIPPLYNWRVLVSYLLWYLSIYTKNSQLVYSWQPELKNFYFLELYQTLHKTYPKIGNLLDKLQQSSLYNFKILKIKSSNRIFGPFQSPEIVPKKRVTTALSTHSRPSASLPNLTKHLLFCFSTDDIIVQKNIFSWNSEYDFSNIDLTMWIDF